MRQSLEIYRYYMYVDYVQINKEYSASIFPMSLGNFVFRLSLGFVNIINKINKKNVFFMHAKNSNEKNE